MFLQEFLPAACGLAVTSCVFGSEICVVAAATTEVSAPCPACGTRSDRVHSRYVRTVADLPCQGRRIVLRITVRRFRCRHVGCPKAVFCERLPDLLDPHARDTHRLRATHRSIGLALGGEAGARLCQRLAVPSSPDTLLRRIRATPPVFAPTPRVLGVDDFAFRKGHTYGTILVDLERHRASTCCRTGQRKRSPTGCGGTRGSRW